jgi:hypothetical protein
MLRADARVRMKGHYKFVKMQGQGKNRDKLFTLLTVYKQAFIFESGQKFLI